MKIIFCSSPLNEKKVDESYEQEYICAKEFGCELGLVHLEELIVNQRPDLAVRRLKKATEREDVLYRGWMLRPEEYELL